jgi:uncharacterized protein
MEQKAFLKELKDKVLKEDQKASLILYGSRARGDGREDSDWDILILVSKNRDVKFENKLRNSIYEVELEHLQLVSAIILSQSEWQSMRITPFYHNVTVEGKVL